MTGSTFNNVFKGPDSVVNYFDPDLQPPVPLVELPAKLNPFRTENVRIYAKMLTALPAQNVKVLPGNHFSGSLSTDLVLKHHCSPEHATS
jgi:hypothetical protein